MITIGFIGLGNMGLPMASNIQAAGYGVCGFDVTETAQKAAQSAGLDLAASAADLAARSEIIIMMLPSGAIALQVSLEILPQMAPDSLLIDCSTIDVASAKQLHDLAKEAGVLCLDAPVSGGVGGASAGTLTFMVGGTQKAFAVGKPLFKIMGQKAVHCGSGGAGQAAKICNNMLLGISMIGTCEAFALADRLGLSQSALFEVVSTSSGSCWSVNTYCPVPGIGPESPADRAYEPGFAAALMLKDLSLAEQAASSTDAATPLGSHAKNLYQQMVDAGFGDVDFSGMIEFLANAKDQQT